MHSGGGGFHGAGGSFHGGGYGGGYHGGYTGGGYSSRGPYAGARGGYAGSHSFATAHPWSWEGHGSRDTSPGWHQFSSGSAGRSGAATSAPHSAASATAGRSVTGAMSRAPIADGHWHSFAAPGSAVARATAPTSITRTASISNNWGWHGNYWYGWHGGWGWPGWNWGWGCCGWGFGIGFGWGWGWGAWGPFWAWPAYWYNPWIYAAGPQPPYVLDPYPA